MNKINLTNGKFWQIEGSEPKSVSAKYQILQQRQNTL